MIGKITIAGIALSLSLAAPSLADDCALKRFASLDMIAGPDGSIAIPVLIQGASYRFRLNAFGPGQIGSNLADQLKLEREPVPDKLPMFVDGHQIKNMVSIPALSLGGEGGRLDLPQAKVPEDPSPQSNATEPEGTLGHEYLRYFDLDLDFGNGKLNLFSPEHCAGKVVYWAKEYTDVPIDFLLSLQSITAKGRSPDPGAFSKTMPTPSGKKIQFSTLPDSFDGSLNGNVVPASINTEIAHSRMSMDMAQALFDLAPNSPGIETIAGTGEDRGVHYRYRFASLKIGNIEVKNPDIELWPTDPAAEEKLAAGLPPQLLDRLPKPPALELGTDILRQLHIYFAANEGKFYVTAADAH
jgi:hypothetical protein